ncbi:MAG: helix-turn-helix domain-containing protein [Mycobacteriales bacterium]|nr:MAG: AraC family transcriptional regulator [Pseudonocardiales bacterium]
MSPPASAFERFLDLVADALDEPELSGADLAARAHLSRFHFDRVVAAAAGETPRAFRRRILLERAAYRLMTTGDSVLTIAVGAGYGSHEAFTRAFARAFRESPSVWRHARGSYYLAAHSGVHFHPPGGLRVPARRKVTDMELVQRLVDHHVWLIGEIIERAARLGEDALDKPIEMSVDHFDGDPTIRSQIALMVIQEERWSASIEGRVGPEHADWNGDESVDGLRSRHAAAGRRFRDVVAELTSAGRLDETFLDTSCEPPEVFTYGGMIAHVLTFGGFRRELVLLALAAAGSGDLGIGDPREWVGEPSAR